jgi:uncharacterized membrane protein
MNMEPAEGDLERRLAATLGAGTWAAVAVIALGLVWTLFAVAGQMIVMAGIAIIILLPVARVAMMLAAYVKARDFRLVAVAAVVLLMIGLGMLAGLDMAHRPLR